MAKYANNFTDELRARLSIVDIVGRRVPLSKKGQNFWGCCPFHNEKTPSFSVNEEKGFYHCFGCGEHGDIISFTMKSNNIDFKEAIAELAQQAGLKLPDYKPKSPEQTAREQNYFEIHEAAAKLYQVQLFSAAGAHALEYIRKRGFTDDMIRKYRLGYAPKGNVIATKFNNQKEQGPIAAGLCRRGDYGLYDFFRDKLMFPIFDPKGQIIAFSGRSLDGSEPKYINTSDTELFHKRRTVFGLNFARDAIYKANRSIVVEGQIDVIQMQTHGFPETVAPLGTALTEEHLQILCKSNRNITFCFDGDTAGQKAAARAADIIMPLLRDNSDVRFAFVAGGKDPDEILRNGKQGTEQMKKIIDSSVPLVDFLWNLANKSHLIQTPGGRTQAEKFLKTEIEKITDPNLKNEYKQEYDQRKFNEWHKWQRAKSKEQKVDMPIPNVDALTRKTLSEIAGAYPELIERHAEFLAKIGMDFNNSNATAASQLSAADAEKFIVSMKLKNYLEMLQSDRKNIMAKILSSKDSPDQSIAAKLKTIDDEIKKTMEKINKISEI
jgi:DNA primase